MRNLYRVAFCRDSKALKWAHSKLGNHFSNVVYRQKLTVEIRIRDRVKYMSN